MRSNSTNHFEGPNRTKLALSTFVLLFVIIFGSYTLGQETNLSPNDGNKSFSFNQNGSDWRVYFRDNEIADLYRNGTRIPDDEIDQYRDMVYEKLGELKSEYKDFSHKAHKYYFDVEKFKDDMDKFKKDFDADKFMHFKIEIDEKDFENNMKELKKELKELDKKKIELYFDSEEFKDNMKELKENLKNLQELPNPSDMDIDVHFNMKEFEEGMEEFKEEFKLHKFKIDSSAFDMKELQENMKELKKNMKGLKIEISDVGKEVKKLNKFLKELKSELVEDGYLNSDDEDYSLEMDANKTIINGVEAKKSDHQKYKDLYEDVFDKEIDGKIKIKNN